MIRVSEVIVAPMTSAWISTGLSSGSLVLDEDLGKKAPRLVKNFLKCGRKGKKRH